MTAEFSPASQILSKPGTATFFLMVYNTGNSEDSYSATIMGTRAGHGEPRGPGWIADAVDLDLLLPGLSTGEIELQADLSALGRGA